MAFLKKLISGEDTDEYEENEVEYEKDDLNINAENKMILLEPRAYSESQQIADYLKAKSSVVVNLKRVTPDQAKRIVDFLTGAIYAIGGNMQKLGGGIFLCTPKNINVEGKITDDAQLKANKKQKQEDEDELNW